MNNMDMFSGKAIWHAGVDRNFEQSRQGDRVSMQRRRMEQEQPTCFTFAGDSSLSSSGGGKTKDRETSSRAPAACRPRAIARRQLST